MSLWHLVHPLCSWSVTFSLQIFIPQVGPNVAIFAVNLLKFFCSALFKIMFHISFFFSDCQEVFLYKVSTVKKQRNVLYVFFNRIKNVFTSKLLSYIKTFKTRKVLKFWSVHRVRSEVVDGNLLPIWEYSSSVKNWQKWASVHHWVGVKELNMKYIHEIWKYETVHVFLWTRLISFLKCIA